MQNSEFEKSVRQQMEELKIVPSSELWHSIESKLPAPRKDRRWIMLFVLLGLVTGLAILNRNKLVPATQEETINNPARISGTGRVNPTVPENKQNDNNPAGVNTKNPVTRAGLPIGASTDAGLPGKAINGQFSSGHNTTTITLSSITGAGLTEPRSRNRFSANQQAKAKVATEPATATADENIITTKTVIPGAKADTLNNAAIVPAPGLTDLSKNTITHDTLKSPADLTYAHAQQPTTNKQNQSAWVYGIHLGAGLSAVKNGLFSDARVFADAQGNLSTSNPGQGSTATPASPDNPRAAVSFEAGIYLKKLLGNHWALSTGVNYDYQSNSLETGGKVDSAAVVRFSSDNFRSTHFYRTGRSDSYRNKYHMLTVPLIVEYRFTNKSALTATFGPSISYLLQTNSLVYNRALGGYATNESVFNKTLVSLNLGAGMDLTKLTRLPLRLGYRFQYSLGSVTKPTFGKQHLLNSTFYLDIPLKK